MQTPQIVIEDLPKLEHLSEEEMAEIFGAGPRGYRPMVEQLESREVMSASAMSNLGGTVAQFALQSNGHLEMTKGQVSTDLGLAQGLFQGKDAAGHLLAFELVNQQMDEFNGSAFAPVGGATTSALSEFQTLMIYGGEGHIQIGSYLQADVSVQTNASGATEVTFNSVTLNVGSFLSSVATNLQNVTKPLANLATTLQQPLLPQAWAASLTPLNLLKLYSNSDYQQANDIVNTINAINNLNAQNSATVTISTPFSIVMGGKSGPAFVSAPDLSGIADLVSPYTSGISGLQISLADQQQFLKLLTGATANLFSYTLTFKMDPISLDQRLATIPISPETATELDLDLVGGLSVSGGATFGFDSSHLQSGNLAQGFYVQDANVTATATIGLAGTINEAYLAGYRLTGELTGGASATVTKKTYADSTGSIPVQLTADPVKLVFVQSTLGPEQLIGQYLTPAAADAAKQALENGANNAGVAISNAFNSASARFGASLGGVGQTAGGVGTVLQGLYYSPQMQAQQAATIINNLETGATNALKSGAKTWQAGEKWLAGTPAAQTLGNVSANIKNDASNSAKDIAGVLKNVFSTSAGQTAQVLHGLGQSANEIASALNSAKYSLADTFWALAGADGENLGMVAGLNGLVGAGLLTNSGNAVANFLLTQAGASVAQTASAIYAWVGGNKLYNTFWSINSVSGYGLVGGLNGLVGAGLLTNSGNAVAKFLLTQADASVSQTASAIYGWVGGNKLYNTFWSINSVSGYGLVGGLNGLVGAGLLTNSGNAVANFLLTQAGASVSQTASAIYAWVGGNKLYNTFWSINSVSGYGLVGGLNGLVGAGLLTNSGNAVAKFLLTQADASVSQAASAIYGWVGGNKLYNTFWSINSVSGYGLVGGLNGLVGAGLLANSGNAVAKFLLTQAGASVSQTASAIYAWVGGNKLYNTFWSINSVSGYGLVGGLNGLVGAGLLTNSGNAVANFLLTQADASVAQTASAIYSWVGGNKLYNTFWSINSVSGYGLVGGLNGLVGAGLLANSGNAVASFLLTQAGASVAQTASAIYGWVGGNKLYNTFWSINSVSGYGLVGGLNGLVGAGLLANDSFTVASFLLNTANASLADTASAINGWLGGNVPAAFWAVANGAGRGDVEGIQAIVGANLLGNSYGAIYNFLVSQMSVSSALGVLSSLGFSTGGSGWSIGQILSDL